MGPKKLTDIQFEIIKAMKDNWELGCADGSKKCWLQCGGLNKGGETKSVSFPTIKSLLEKEYIEQAGEERRGRIQLKCYKLTKKYVILDLKIAEKMVINHKLGKIGIFRKKTILDEQKHYEVAIQLGVVVHWLDQDCLIIAGKELEEILRSR